MLATEGTYPFHQGGVSTWCDLLVNRSSDVGYVIYAVLMDPFVTQKFELPASAELIKMPLWGTEEPSEHLSIPFSQTFLSKKRTTPDKIHQLFIPLFEELVREIMNPIKNPKRMGRVLLELHLFFQYYEYKVSFKSEEAWETYKRIVLEHVAKDSQLSRPDIYSLIQSLGWIYRFLNILNTPVPDVDVTHSSAAAFCSIPCILAKLKKKTPFMLTEHGVYLREQYLSLAKREYSTFLNTFLMRLVHTVTSLNYTFADQVSPVCHYNTRWEHEFGVEPHKVRVIYNGVDKDIFMNAKGDKSSEPTVVAVARIDPIKDIEMLIRAAAIVKQQIPNVKFKVFGSVSVPSYYEQCIVLRDKLGLGDMFQFVGHSTNIAAAYKSGDLVALTSISEAFPYSVVEAMMAGTAVVSTDVGGIREALGNTGVLVPARDHEKMAEEVVRLLQSPDLRNVMIEEARERALSRFTIEKVLNEHYNSYLRLTIGAEQTLEDRLTEAAATRQTEPFSPAPAGGLVSKTQGIWMERGLALKYTGFYPEAARCFRQAIEEQPGSTCVPVLLLELAETFNHMGEYDLAFQELEKFEIFKELMIA
jgi:glycosyltransferase involved in cell wall biosynthesis